MAPFDIPDDGFRVPAPDLLDWTARVIRQSGTPGDIADDVAQVLVAADLRGIASHGTGRLPIYFALAEAGIVDPRKRPMRVGGRPVIELWDAGNGWGPHAGRVIMDDTIERAGALGLAASVVRHANHFGIAGWYAMRAATRGMIGVAMTNTTPLVAPTRGRTRLVGTNPIAFAAPAGRFGMLVLDMATSTVTWGRLLVAARRGTRLPAGVAIDRAGRSTESPAVALDGGALMPLGGGEETAGYKGYGLALMVDVMTGVLSGANFGPWVLPFSVSEGPSNLGQLFVAVDPDAVDLETPARGGFESRLEALIESLVTAPVGPDAPGPVLIPGQPEALREAEQLREGISLDAGHHGSLVELGERLGHRFPTAMASATAPTGDPAAERDTRL